MIMIHKPHILSKAVAFINYARAGSPDTNSVDVSYYTPERIARIGKMLNALLRHNSFEAYTQEHYEVAYLRFCEYWDIGKLVALADWKSLIDVICKKLQTCTDNQIIMLSLTCLSLKRIWKVILALYRAK